MSTGSRPWIPPIPGLREVEPLTSATAFERDRLPESVIVLGGVGLVAASVWDFVIGRRAHQAHS